MWILLSFSLYWPYTPLDAFRTRDDCLKAIAGLPMVMQDYKGLEDEPSRPVVIRYHCYKPAASR